MFISEKLIFLELHKTGSSHIGKMLREVIGGEQRDKHNALDFDPAGRYVIGSVRDPWDWYVSLWAFGCSGQGSVFHQLTDHSNIDHYRHDLPREMSRRFSSPSIIWNSWRNDRKKSLAEWRNCYADHKDAALFRRWLHMLLDPSHSLDVREGYGFSPVSAYAGLLTFRYLKLFTRLGKRLYTQPALTRAENLPDVFKQESTVDFIIRNEHLEADLLQAIHQAGIELPASQRDRILSARKEKTNTSNRLGLEHYYDLPSALLVAEKERFLIGRHGYELPAGLNQ